MDTIQITLDLIRAQLDLIIIGLQIRVDFNSIKTIHHKIKHLGLITAIFQCKINTKVKMKLRVNMEVKDIFKLKINSKANISFQIKAKLHFKAKVKPQLRTNFKVMVKAKVKVRKTALIGAHYVIVAISITIINEIVQ